MRVTLTSKLVGARVNESTAFTLVASFFDDSVDNWTASTPTSTKYRIDRVNGADPVCSQTVLDWTSLTPATSNSIAITGAQNAVVGYGPYETRQVTVRANDGLSTQYQETFRYRVVNLAGQT